MTPRELLKADLIETTDKETAASPLAIMTVEESQESPSERNLEILASPSEQKGEMAARTMLEIIADLEIEAEREGLIEIQEREDMIVEVEVQTIEVERSLSEIILKSMILNIYSQ